MADSSTPSSTPTKSYSADPTLYLYTSLTAGSSHIITATSRIETILKANKIPFQGLDVATDEKARMLWGRRAGKRKLPGLVKMGMVLGDLTEIEEWNEYGELHEKIGEVQVPATPFGSVTATPTNTPSKPAPPVAAVPEDKPKGATGGVATPFTLAMRQAGEEAARKAAEGKSSKAAKPAEAGSPATIPEAKPPVRVATKGTPEAPKTAAESVTALKSALPPSPTQTVPSHHGRRLSIPSKEEVRDIEAASAIPEGDEDDEDDEDNEDEEDDGDEDDEDEDEDEDEEDEESEEESEGEPDEGGEIPTKIPPATKPKPNDESSPSSSSSSSSSEKLLAKCPTTQPEDEESSSESESESESEGEDGEPKSTTAPPAISPLSTPQSKGAKDEESEESEEESDEDEDEDEGEGEDEEMPITVNPPKPPSAAPAIRGEENSDDESSEDDESEEEPAAAIPPKSPTAAPKSPTATTAVTKMEPETKLVAAKTPEKKGSSSGA